MKKLFALLAGALFCFGVAFAGEESILETNNLIHKYRAILARMPVEEAKAKLEAVRDTIANYKGEQNEIAKARFAYAVTVAWYRENLDTVKTFAQLYEHYQEELKKVNAPKATPANQWAYDFCALYFCNKAFNPDGTDAIAEEGYEQFKSSTNNAVCWELVGIAEQLKKPKEEIVEFCQHIGTRGVWRLTLNHYMAEAAQLFWKYLQTASMGNPEDNLATVYTQVIAYELAQENFDAEALKKKLTRAIMLYKTKARSWKPSKEGEANPYVEFVGMMQDTVKDL